MEKKKIFTLLVLLITMLGGAKAETVTAKWDFQNLIPSTMANVNVQQTNEEDVVSDVDGISMHVISTGGKLQYNSSGYAQFNQNTTIQIPVISTSDVVTVVSYPGQSNYTVGGQDATGQNTFSHTATADEVTAGHVDIVATSTGYIYSIQVVQTITEEKIDALWDFQTPNPSSISELSINTGNAGYVASTVSGVSLYVDATSGKLAWRSGNKDAQFNAGAIIRVPIRHAGDEVTVVSYPGYHNYTIAGIAADADSKTYTAVAADETNKYVEIVATGSSYLYSIRVLQKAPDASDPWVNFQNFSMDLRAGDYIHTDETSNTTIGFKKSGENIVRTTSDDTDAIGTLTGKFHDTQHGLQNFSMSVAVPGYAKVTVGTCSFGSNLTISSPKGFSKTININTGACYHQNTANNKVSVYYTMNEGTTLTIAGGGYMSFIAVENATFYDITGTISGGTIDGDNIILTSTSNGQTYQATVSSGNFSLAVPADTYELSLTSGTYIISSPASVVVSGAGSVGTVNITAAVPQTVTGNIVNAPAEAFTLTFTGANSNEVVNLSAGATSYSTTLAPDTYTISSSVGTLSTLSKESFTVLSSAVAHNIYYPEAAVPAATQQNITVDNTAVVAANVYRTITDALAAAKAGSISSPVITLTSGQTYQEQVIIDQANVTLKTSGEGKATITWYYGIGYTYYSLASNGYYDKDRANTRNGKLTISPARWGATVLVMSTGAGFKAENIIFENSFNQRYTAEEVADGVTHNGLESISVDRVAQSVAADSKAATERAAAIAFENNPTGCELYNCEFIGSQDTFYSSGNVHVKSSSITGNTDFIFGGTGGTTLFDNCDLVIGGYSDSQNTAYITANQAGQFIFRDCTVKGSGRTYVKANLGRDWGGTNANVYFFNLKNEIGDKLSYSWTDMGGAVTAGTANLHIYDFDATVNANYSTTGASGANVNGVLTDEQATTLYTGANSSADSGSSVVYATDLTFDETGTYNALKIAANNGTEVNVTLKGRTIHGDAGHWNTICLPYAMTASQIAGSVLSGAVIKELSGATIDGSSVVISFSTVTAMEAGKPYIICWETDQADAIDPLFEGVSIAGATPGSTTAGVATFHGTYMPFTMTANDKKQLYLKDKQLWYPTAAITVKPFRGYFTLTQDVPASVNKFVLDTDGEGVLTGIESVRTTQPADAVYYNLNGQRVDKPAKGLYIVNGKKVVVK